MRKLHADELAKAHRYRPRIFRTDTQDLTVRCGQSLQAYSCSLTFRVVGLRSVKFVKPQIRCDPLCELLRHSLSAVSAHFLTSHPSFLGDLTLSLLQLLLCRSENASCHRRVIYRQCQCCLGRGVRHCESGQREAGLGRSISGAASRHGLKMMTLHTATSQLDLINKAHQQHSTLLPIVTVDGVCRTCRLSGVDFPANS